jgi:hypothetical protein
VRTWTAWYRFITLALLAHAFLVVMRLQAQAREQKRGTLNEDDERERWQKSTACCRLGMSPGGDEHCGSIGLSSDGAIKPMRHKLMWLVVAASIHFLQPEWHSLSAC